MLSKFCPESWALWAVVSAVLHNPMIDCCNAQLQMPRRDILLSFEHEIDRSYCIHNKNGTYMYIMFHETVSRKLLVFTLYVYPYMLKRVSHLNLLDELITTLGVLFLVFFFFIQISNEQQRRT